MRVPNDALFAAIVVLSGVFVIALVYAVFLLGQATP